MAATRARDSAKDISLGTGGWTGGASDGTTLWFVDNSSDEARAYVAATRARDSAKDISLGAGIWTGAVSDGTTLWFTELTGNQVRAYVAATRARDAAKDIAIGTGDWSGGLSDGTTLWFVEGNSDAIIAYLASDQSRQAADDITHADLAGSLNGGVYANGTAWFVEPDADTAIAFRQTTPTVDHAVDAGAVSWAFNLPQPTVTHTPAAVDPLLLSDFVVPAGRVQVFAGLIEIQVSGENVYRPGSGIGSLVDGNLELTSTIDFNRMRVRSGPRVLMNRSGAGSVRDYLDANDNGIFHFQDSAGVDTQTVSSITVADRLNGGVNLRDADITSRVDDLLTGDRLIVAFTVPEVTTVDHAVDAGAVAWAFALPEPTVTHTPAGVTTDHAVDAGAVSWVFALPQPTVTHTTAAPTTDHAVDAGAVSWAFHLPEPTVTHSLPAGATIWSQYAITIQTDPPTRFWTGRGRLDYSGDLFEGGGQAVGVGEVELVSGNPDRRLTITLSSIPSALRAQFLQDVGAVEVEVALIFSADRGSTWQSAPLSYSGRLSSPTMVNGRLTVELETLRGDVDHGEVRYWSHEDQMRRFPGDKGMEYMRQLAQKGTETSWPP